MAYLSSANVKVYPCAYRGNGYDPEARLTSEKNLTSLINAFGARYYDESTVKDSSFVISWANPKIKFVIGGYIFEADLTGQLTADNIYAHIRVNPRHTPTVGSEATDWTCTSLVDFNSGGIEGTLDDTGSFGGLSIDNSPTAANATSDLHILEKVGNDYTVPSESIARVSSYYVGQANEIPGTGTIYYSPIDVAFRTASLTAGNATVGGTLGVSGAATLASLSVTGNATVGGILGVTGATTFTGAVTANSTLSVISDTTLNAGSSGTTFVPNGAIILGDDGNPSGVIYAEGSAEFGGSDGVKTNKLSAYTTGGNITLTNSIIPNSNTLHLGSNEYPIAQGHFTKIVNGGDNPLTLEDFKIVIRPTNTNSALCVTKNLMVGSDSISGAFSGVGNIYATGRVDCDNMYVQHAASFDQITMRGGISGDGTINLTYGGSIKASCTDKGTNPTITLAGNHIWNIMVEESNTQLSFTLTLLNSSNTLKACSTVGGLSSAYRKIVAIRTSTTDTDWTLSYTDVSERTETPGRWYATAIMKF